ncbi:hypothetical protein FoTM2_007427 [Fusarium oxysporum f. sp. vasinfectum]|nr:hypothetical protein FoTM2_007427 [Fusarium oxysporum f. sp. vasinfectum]
MSSQAVPDTQLGLTNEEIQLLRQGQAALGGGPAARAPLVAPVAKAFYYSTAPHFLL